MKTFKITWRELDKETGQMKNFEKIIQATHKEYAREKFKKEIGNVPLNYRIQEVK